MSLSDECGVTKESPVLNESLVAYVDLTDPRLALQPNTVPSVYKTYCLDVVYFSCDCGSALICCFFVVVLIIVSIPTSEILFLVASSFILFYSMAMVFAFGSIM